jgi:RNA polymerase sigma-70 factor (ECF subfamily)
MTDHTPAALSGDVWPAAAGASAADGPLVERWRGGDQSVFADIVARYQPRLARLAYRLLGWRDEVDDVVQDVFVRALEKRGSFRGEASLATWLTRIMLNACRNRLRRRRLARVVFPWRRGTRPHSADAADPGSSSAVSRARPDGAVSAGERAESVRRAVRSLPDREREVIVLRYLEDLPIEVIAGIVNETRGAVDVRLSRARQRLRQALADMAENRP